jgi:adenylate kinase family enzyme
LARGVAAIWPERPQKVTGRTVDRSHIGNALSFPAYAKHTHETRCGIREHWRGKSTLARRMAELTRLTLLPLDLIQFKPGGEAVSQEEFLRAHAELLQRDTWIIDGYGTLTTGWERFGVADTLVYIDLPLVTHFWFVTKRLLTAPFVAPEGWPENSPIWHSTVHCYKVIWSCHRQLTPRYRQFVADMAASKRVHHLKSLAEMAAFLDAIRRETT